MFNSNINTMKTITFYSYKGGVGRSLALANIATRLAELGKKVCLLDFDLEAPGLYYKFSSLINSKNFEIKQGIVDYIYQFADDVVIMAANNRGNLDGVKKIIRSIKDPNNSIFGKPPNVTFVLSRIPFDPLIPEEKAKEQSLISKIEREFGLLITEVNIIHSD